MKKLKGIVISYGDKESIVGFFFKHKMVKYHLPSRFLRKARITRDGQTFKYSEKVSPNKLEISFQAMPPQRAKTCVWERKLAQLVPQFMGVKLQ